MNLLVDGLEEKTVKFIEEFDKKAEFLETKS